MPPWSAHSQGSSARRFQAPKFGENFKCGYIGFVLAAEEPVPSGILLFSQEIALSSLRVRRVFVVVDEQSGVEATCARGVAKFPLLKYFDAPRLGVVFRKPRKLNAQTGQFIAEAAIAQVGLRYSQLLAAAKLLDASFLGRWLRSAFPDPSTRFPGLLEDRHDPWVSAELAAHSLASQPSYAGVGVLARRAHPIHPQELFEDSELFASWKFEGAVAQA